MKRVCIRRFRRRRRFARRLRIAVIAFISVIALVGLAFFQCRPIMTAFAESQAVWNVTKIANQTAMQVLSEYAAICEHTLSVEYDGSQKVSSILTKTADINMVRTIMTETVMKAIERSASIAVAIPLGTLSGWHWLSGLGPLLTFPVSFTAAVLSDTSSSLVATGINQSTYRVLIHLDISLYVVTPMGRSTVGTRVSYPMAETVLLGEVPDNLTEVYGDDQSLLGQIFDYGTIE